MLTDNDQRAIDGILGFWFDEETKPRWYKSTDMFDDTCRERFGALVNKAAKGDLAAWENCADGALALCLLLDQIPRNIFRGTAEAFATDPAAVNAATRAIDKGYDQHLDRERRKFLYLPFMHSEQLTDQERCIALCTALGDEDTLHFAHDHADIIRRFGRFPHRNSILGRTSTHEEKAFLEGGAKSYGQAPAADG